jgi:hypothetical protein
MAVAVSVNLAERSNVGNIVPQSYQPVEIRPTMGGALLSSLSDDTTASYNYAVKRNWRRFQEREIRREGFDYLWANPDASLGNQPFPYAEPDDIAESGNWPGIADHIEVHQGWFYLFIAGEKELKALNGEGGPEMGAVLVQAATDEILVYPKAEAIGDARTYQLLEFEPITLIHEARRPNGKKALIVGTPTTLYRFFALDNGDYFLGDYFDATPGPGVPYFADDIGEWIIIASGFNPDAQRWEAVCINGTSIFNNGLDPVFSYRVEEFTAKAVYELRESGIAAVGTIAEFFGILVAGDISEIFAEKLLELFDPIGVRRSGAMTAEIIPGNTVQSTEDFFSADDVGRRIIFDNGISAAIIVFTNAQEVQVGHDTYQSYGTPVAAQTVSPQRFMLRTPASQAGSLFSGVITGTQTNGSPNVLASSAIFDGTMVGKRLRYINGWSSIINAFTDSTHVVLDDNAPEDFALPFFVVSEPEQLSADFIVTAAAPLFTADMVGRNISWDDGEERRIVGFIDSENIYVDADMNIPKQIVGIDNPETYATYSAKEFINRIAYQTIWSMVDQPARFGPVYRGSMDFNGYILKLDQPALSIEIGEKLTVAGAGISGGNLIATVLYVAAHRVIALDTRASTAVVHAPVEKSDVAGSIVGYEYLQDDSSGIIRMLELDGTLVIYKDTAIVLARYTGNPDAPFAFQLKRIDASRTLFYRNTLAHVGDIHVFAGRATFYKFSLVNQDPEILVELELCKNLFFDKATLENSKWIFSANNVLTEEVFITGFDYSDTNKDRALCLDYRSRPFTVSTSDLMITAGASMKRPTAGAVFGEIEDWFIMGSPRGVVLLYGLVFLQSKIFDGAKRILYRRELNPYSATKAPYDSLMRGGLSAFGNPNNEKDIRSWVPILSSKSAKTVLTFTLLGARNPVETPEVLCTGDVDPEENLAPLHFRSNYFADQLEIKDAIDNPCELAGRIIEISGVKSVSDTRREI